MSPSWEGVAAVLQAETVSDLELAERLGCRPAFVARVRDSLGLPAYPAPPRPSPEERFQELARVTKDGHVTWTGRTTRDGVPLVDHFVTAARVAFRLHHGREPEGQVRGTCRVNHCLAGEHLADRVMRELAKGDLKAVRA
ncbi:hypothetical protein [Streptomyces carpinensis]|uniref:Uncharacterized protein n=1 Tax=Streptomyces carpinensis TaxID=66369 RepID=A0ABV1VVP6_9ACTN|nr:hypothetical protein [Streptomyces carpinensis]